MKNMQGGKFKPTNYRLWNLFKKFSTGQMFVSRTVSDLYKRETDN